jgi:hypothetical protein
VRFQFVMKDVRCGFWLVLTGTQAGYLWEDRRSEYGGIKPLRLADGSSATFMGSYDAWLNAK